MACCDQRGTGGDRATGRAARRSLAPRTRPRRRASRAARTHPPRPAVPPRRRRRRARAARRGEPRRALVPVGRRDRAERRWSRRDPSRAGSGAMSAPSSSAGPRQPTRRRSPRSTCARAGTRCRRSCRPTRTTMCAIGSPPTWCRSRRRGSPSLPGWSSACSRCPPPRRTDRGSSSTSCSVDQLYVDPPWIGRGLGRILVDHAKQRSAGGLELWTFQVNAAARRFYARQGFVEVDWTDGAGNEEHEPDVRCRWVSRVGRTCVMKGLVRLPPS